MNPLWFFARVAGTAFITAAGVRVALKQFQQGSPDLVAGAVHFRKGMEEFQKGMSAVLFGSTDSSPEKAKKDREASRIAIE